MIDQRTLEALITRAKKACRTNNHKDGLAPEEVLTVLMEYKELTGTVKQAETEGYKTPQTIEVDAFLADLRKNDIA